MKKILLASALVGLVIGQSHANTISGPSSLYWDIDNNYGTVWDGGHDAFDGYAYSSVGSILVNNFALTYDGSLTHTGTGSTGGLDIDRTIVVDSSLLYATFTDVFTNATGSAVSTRVGWGGNLGSDSATVVQATSSGDLTISAADTWAVTSDTWGPSDPVVAYAWESGVDAINNVHPGSWTSIDNVWAYWDILLNPGETFSMTNILWRGDSSGGTAEVDAAIAGISALADDSTVPVPPSLALLSLGLFGLSYSRRKKA